MEDREDVFQKTHKLNLASWGDPFCTPWVFPAVSSHLFYTESFVSHPPLQPRWVPQGAWCGWAGKRKSRPRPGHRDQGNPSLFRLCFLPAFLLARPRRLAQGLRVLGTRQ